MAPPLSAVSVLPLVIAGLVFGDGLVVGVVGVAVGIVDLGVLLIQGRTGPSDKASSTEPFNNMMRSPHFL